MSDTKYLLLQYPKCSTCRNAKKWLDENGVEYESRDIVVENPTEKELKEWIEQSNYPVRSFFNTSGLVYKDLKLKDKLSTMSEDEQIKLLATNGKLIKRPLVICKGEAILVGFNAELWQKKLVDGGK